MNDLFGAPKTANFSSPEVRKSSQIVRRSFAGPIVKVNSSQCELPTQGRSEKFASHCEAVTLTKGQKPAPQKFGLREQRISLENEIEKLEAELAPAMAAQAPYKTAFDTAHAELVGLHGVRKGDHPVAKSAMLAAYDKRMLAGHAWHPFKSKVREITLALKACRKELTEVNREIGT